MREYWLSLLRAQQFTVNQLQLLAMNCPDEGLETLCKNIDGLKGLQFTTDQMMLLAVGKNGHTIPSVLGNYNTLLTALQSEPNQFVPWKYINDILMKLIYKFTKSQTDFIFEHISKFASHHCNFADFIDLLFKKEGLQNFQVLLSNLDKILEAYALGFKPQDLYTIAYHSAQNLQTLFDKLDMVNRNETLTTEYFTACLSTEGLSDLLLISIEEAVKSNHQSVSAHSVASNEIITVVDDEISDDDVVIVSTNTVSKKRKVADSQASGLVQPGLAMLDAALTGAYVPNNDENLDNVPEFDFSEPTTKRVTTALRASTVETVSTNTTSSNSQDSELPNFGDGVMLLTMSDLETLEADERLNLCITKNGQRISVFPNHDFSGKRPYDTFCKMHFYMCEDNSLAVISKDPSIEFSNLKFRDRVFNGNSLAMKMRKVLDEDQRQVYSKRNHEAHRMCELILAKVGVIFQRRKSKKDSIAPSNTHDSDAPNFGDGVMMLTRSDLENLQVDANNNLYITKNGNNIPVFPNHEFLQKQSMETLKDMQFYVKDNQCLGVFSKEAKTKLNYHSLTANAVILTGRAIYLKMNSAKDVMNKSIFTEQYEQARQLCEILLNKLGICFSRRKRSIAPEIAPATSISSASNSGFFSHPSEMVAQANRSVDTNQKRQP